jgi:choline-sulfatase
MQSLHTLWLLAALTLIQPTARVAADSPQASPPQASPPQASPPQASPPNIVLVITDDQGYGDVAAHGHPLLRTPHLDRLREHSVRLTEFHVSPTCAPTRAALLTGRHEFRSGVTHTIFERERLALEAVTLPQLLRDRAGYATGIFGKWHLGDEDDYQPGRRGFDRVFIHGGGGIGQSYPGSCGDAPGNTYYDPVIRSDGRFVQTSGYCTDVFFDEAIAWIDAQRREPTPFFCYISTNAPHAPYDPPPGAEASYLTLLEAAGIAEQGRPARLELASFLAMIENIDANVGRLVERLDRWGIADDTLLIFITDNGTAAGASLFNAGMRGQKGTVYRGGTRVPSFWRWPGRLPAGVDVPVPTAHIDVLPTLCELAGLQLPDELENLIEGRSLRPLLEDADAAWPARPLFTHLGRWEHGAAADSAYARCRVMEGQWSLVNVANRPDSWELYDLHQDPAEQRNIAEAHPDRVARLVSLYDRWWVSVQPQLVNENLTGPAANPFKTAYREQFGQPAASHAPLPIPSPTQIAATSLPGDRQPRPNILFILADDQSPFDFRFYNPASTLEAPVIEQLAATGMVVDRAYHMGSFSGAVCLPSRTMLMTGRGLWQLPIGPGRDLCPPEIADYSLPALFNAAGYDTMRTCKEGNSYEAANQRFRTRHDATKRGGTPESGSAWHADRVLDYLRQRQTAENEQPFLIFLGFSHPHDVRDGTPELLAKYGATNHTDEAMPPALDARQPPLPENWLPEHPFDHGHIDVRDEVDVSGVWRRRDEATIRNEIGRQFACSENIDRQIGRVLQQLDAMGELEQTWIFYTADHGMAIGRHGLQGKQNLYEHTWRVPLVVKGPGVSPGSRAVGNVYLSDILATLCDICGIQPPATQTGSSFLPVLLGDQPSVRQLLYGAYSGGQQPGIRSLRVGDWKLIKYESPTGGLQTELFHLADNPHEFLPSHHQPQVWERTGVKPSDAQRNLADDPQHTEVRRRMERLLLAEMVRRGDPYRFSDQPAPR